MENTYADEDRGQSQPILKFVDISKSFVAQDLREYRALEGVNLELEAGQFVALVGPSGCGKTTLMKIAANIASPTSGQVFFEGREGAIATGKFGMVFQSPALLQWRTIVENVLLPLEVGKGRKYARRQRDLAESLLARVKLHDVGSKYPHELSGGMQQRVAIARALATDPEMLLMDEPFAALDALTRETLNHSLQALHLEMHKTVIFVTHNIDEAVFLADRIIVLSASPGTIVADLESGLPRPRTNESYSDPRFTEVAAQVRELLNGASVA